MKENSSGIFRKKEVPEEDFAKIRFLISKMSEQEILDLSRPLHLDFRQLLDEICKTGHITANELAQNMISVYLLEKVGFIPVLPDSIVKDLIYDIRLSCYLGEFLIRQMHGYLWDHRVPKQYEDLNTEEALNQLQKEFDTKAADEKDKNSDKNKLFKQKHNLRPRIT